MTKWEIIKRIETTLDEIQAELLAEVGAEYGDITPLQEVQREDAVNLLVDLMLEVAEQNR
jgi:hypothetical protein